MRKKSRCPVCRPFWLKGAEPEHLPPYLKATHDATPEENWLGRHFARALSPAPDLVQAYQAFYHPWYTGGAGLLPPRLKELVRPRIATRGGCVLCKSVRMGLRRGERGRGRARGG